MTNDAICKLIVVLAQMALKETLPGNRDTILDLMRAARERVDARLVRAGRACHLFVTTF